MDLGLNHVLEVVLRLVLVSDAVRRLLHGVVDRDRPVVNHGERVPGPRDCDLQRVLDTKVHAHVILLVRHRVLALERDLAARLGQVNLEVEQVLASDLLGVDRHRRRDGADLVRHVRVGQAHVLLHGHIDLASFHGPTRAIGADLDLTAHGAGRLVDGGGAGPGGLGHGEALGVVVNKVGLVELDLGEGGGEGLGREEGGGIPMTNTKTHKPRIHDLVVNNKM